MVVGELKFNAPPAILTPASPDDEPRWARIKTHVRTVQHRTLRRRFARRALGKRKRVSYQLCSFLDQFRDLCYTTISDRLRARVFDHLILTIFHTFSFSL